MTGMDELLAAVQRRFYPATARRSQYYRDRRMLVYALSWPAVWLSHRGLTCAPVRYRALLVARLDAIAEHGDPEKYGAYFPAYLLKCLQNWFQHHGEELYDELKHVRNALDQVLASASFAAEVRADGEKVDVLATAHRLIAARRPVKKESDPAQLRLF
jgi:hypothetical protein